MRINFQKSNTSIISILIIVSSISLVLFFAEKISQSVFYICNTVVMILLLIYMALYQFFWRRHERIIQEMIEYMGNNTLPNFKEHDLFAENQKLSALSKKLFIHSNLLKKDFADIKWIFEKFIPHNIRKDIGYAGYERIVLGSAKSKKVSIMFLDVRGFTALSESMSDPYKILLLLNIFFDGIGEIIEQKWGFIDNFIGDGILAVFEEEDTESVIETALEIQEFMIKMQHFIKEEQRVGIGIGINSGEVIFGTIGTKDRMSATIIGDAVNTASRIQAMTRELHVNILISENTLSQLVDKEKFLIEGLGERLPRGKKNTVNIYSVSRK